VNGSSHGDEQSSENAGFHGGWRIGLGFLFSEVPEIDKPKVQALQIHSAD
jgi:hypothetical protein